MPEKNFSINLAGSPNSCVIQLGKQRYRALVDTGAEVSLVHRRVFDKLKHGYDLGKQKVNLQAVNGNKLQVDGCATIKFKLGGRKFQHTFYVVDGLNRNVILGRDWIIDNKVVLYFNELRSMKIGQVYVPLEEDIHISALVRAASTVVIKPHTAVICKAKTSGVLDSEGKQLCQISPTDRGYLSMEPGLQLQKSVVEVKAGRTFAALISNRTSKTFRVKRGSVIGKLERLKEENIVNSVRETGEEKGKAGDDWLDDLSVPGDFEGGVKKLVTENRDLFAQTDAELGHTDTVKMKLDTGEHPPIKMKPYRTPLNKRAVIDNAVDEMLEAGIIRRSRSPWSFPVVVVDKKDGSKRFCVDFRQLNKITKPISYPLPVIDDILARLGKAKYFTTLDLKSGYWQVLMDERDREKTAFACHRGLFEFLVMPFGLSGAPPVFMELMNIVLEGLEDFAIPYLDDIIIFSASPDEHLSHLRAVFNKIREHGLKMKLKKCNFFQTETKYLGFTINGEGIQPDPEKVEAIREMAAPSNVREVRGFIGTCSYYRRFIPNFSEIAQPLIELTKKFARFKWTVQCQKAFDYLKDSLTVVPLLVYPDTQKPYVLYTDASDTCIGAVLTQKGEDGEGKEVEKPIYFLSHKLSDTQCRWSTIEKEAYAIHYSLQKLDHYLHGAEFMVRTDHKPLKYLLESPMQNRKVQMWALSIAGYNCQIEYIEGVANTVADLLSRTPQGCHEVQNKTQGEEEVEISDKFLEVNALNSNRFDPKFYAGWENPGTSGKEEPETTWEGMDMVEEQDKDGVVRGIKEQLESGKAVGALKNRHLILGGLLYYLSDPDNDPTPRLYIPKQLQDAVIKQYHDDNGHMGIDKTFESIKRKYYFPNLYQKLTSYVNACVTCQTRALKKQRPPLQEMEQPPYPFAKLSMDISGPYPTSLSGNRYILSVVDHYTGWPEAFAIPDKSAQSVAHILVDEIFPRFGCPCEVITDNGTENENQVMKEVFAKLNIHHVTTSFYHPQSNAKVERFHRTLHDVLSKLLKDDSTVWDLYLNQALAAIRFNHNDSSKFSPFFLVYNRDVVLPIDNILKPRRKYVGEEQHKIALQQQHKLFTLVHNHMKRAKKRQAKYADRGSKPVDFQVGDPVYYKRHQRRNKLEGKWQPYYRVVEKTSPVTYVIRNQLDGVVVKVHAEHLRLAKVEEWEIPTNDSRKPYRRAAYVVPPQESSEESSSSESEGGDPLPKISRWYRRERDNSSEEENIPLAELAGRLKARERRLEREQGPVERHKISDDETSAVSDEAMSVDGIMKKRGRGKSSGRVRNLLSAILNVL